MLESVKEERARHFQLALRIGIPVMVLVLVLAYSVFFHSRDIVLNTQSVILMSGLIFVVVYFIYFALEQSQKESILDPITGGYKYEYFIRSISKKSPKTLAALKVNNLELINENYGIRRTDTLLREITDKLNRFIFVETSAHPLIGRKVGAEFLIAVDVEPKQVKETLEKFIEMHTNHDGIDVSYTYTLIAYDNDNPENALEQLRDLLNSAGKCRFIEKEKIIPNAIKLSENEKKILKSISKENIELLFRPIMNLKSGKVDIYEVSIRLRTEDGELLLPRHFLPVINRHNLGLQYDTLIYEKIIELIPLVENSIFFSFNLSPFSLRQKKFHEMMINKINEKRLDANRIIIELYEKKTHHRLDNYLGILSVLKRHGFQFCLDNFGSSNASMEYIKYFHFDMVQFDREYINYLDNKKHLSIFKSLVKMVQDLDIKTIAKWVDSDKAIAILKEMDIDYIQGFSVGKVIDERELISIYNPINKERV